MEKHCILEENLLNIFNFIKNLFIILAICSVHVFAEEIVVSGDKPLSILQKSEILVDDKGLSVDQVVKSDAFMPVNKDFLNFGFTDKTIWIKFTLVNDTNQTIERLLVTQNTIAEHVALYNAVDLLHPSLVGVRHLNGKHGTLFPIHKVILPPHKPQTYYLRIKNDFAGTRFGLSIYSEKVYMLHDKNKQVFYVFLLGIVFALMFFSLLLFFYLGDKAFLYYAIFLFFSLWWQISYLGLFQIYFSRNLVMLDNMLLSAKINFILIASAIFSINFLEVYKVKIIYILYRAFIWVAIIDIILFSSPWFYQIEFTLFISILYILFSALAGVVLYFKGVKQAKLYILGTGMVLIIYMIMATDAFGITQVFNHTFDAVLYALVFEAMILSLALVDRYKILREEKELADKLLLRKSHEREKLVQYEVDKKTGELKKALQTQEVLFHELHHRVKNNLQMILSLNDLQKEEYEDRPEIMEIFQKWESRITAIAKIHELIYMSNDMEMIDMEEYIENLVENLEHSYVHKDIVFDYDVNLSLPLRKAVYIGLIINELVSNAIKYAFQEHSGVISITLNEEMLQVSDTGMGFDFNRVERYGTGLKLVNILVKEQLGGTLEIKNEDGMHFIIRFGK